ncbi:putative methyltransferase-like protein 24 [Ciona intestinalis]
MMRIYKSFPVICIISFSIMFTYYNIRTLEYALFRTIEVLTVHENYNVGVVGHAPPQEESERLWEFVHKLQYQCKKPARIGGNRHNGDGSYEICFEDKYWPLQSSSSHKCLVYSFGIGGDISFDEGLANKGCEVHSFDPSTEWEDGRVFPSGVTFHKIGISDKDLDADENGWKMRTLKTILKELGHSGRVLDVLKVDTDAPDGGGFEDRLMQELLDTGLHKCVRQLTMEIHIPGPISRPKWLNRCRTVYRQMMQMNDNGYKTFNVTDNVRYLQTIFNDPSITGEKNVRPYLAYGINTALWEITQVNTQVTDTCVV